MAESESHFVEFTFKGFKNIEPIVCRSNLMFTYLRWFEWNPEVRYYFQPFIDINVEFCGFMYPASIDFWVTNKENQVHLVHLLDKETVRTYEEHPKLKLMIGEQCRKMKMKYFPIESSKQQQSTQIKNLTFLWTYARIEIKLLHRLLIGVFFKKQNFPTLGKLKVFLQKHGLEIELAYSMIFHKVVLADIDFVILSDETALQSNAKALRNVKSY